jgi:hypothetical protein
LKKAGIIFALVALTILTGCSKFSVECELVLQPHVMISSGSDPLAPAYMARAYVFYTDDREFLTPDRWPSSYADAEAGIIRHRTTGEGTSFNLMEAQGDDTYIHLTLTKSPMVLVAVDPINRIYAWRTFKYEIPLERIYVPVSFKAYQQTPYKENEWTVIKESDENAPPQEEDPTQTAK